MSSPHRIGVRMHGVSLNLSCDYEKHLAHTAALLGDHVCEPWKDPEIEVECSWRVDTEDLRAPVFELDGLDAFGKRMHVGEDVLVWTDHYRDKNLQLRFCKENGRRRYEVVYHYKPSTKKLAKYPDYEEKKFFDLVRYVVLFPIAWHLRRTRGWEMIHASAVSNGERAALIAGPGGAGKTTSSVALVALAGMRLLTENLVFTDGSLVYPVSEPIRLTPESLELLGESAQHLRPFEAPGGLKKKAMFLPPVDPDAPGVEASVLFLTRFTSEGYARRLPPAVAYRQTQATNTLTLELNDFYWYAAALDFLWPAGGPTEGDSIHHLIHRIPSYTLGIDRQAGVGPVVEQILECFHGKPTTAAHLESK